MMRKARAWSCVLGALVVVGCAWAPAAAQEHPEHPRGQERPKGQEHPEAREHPTEHPTPEHMQQMMEKWAELGRPGEHHEHLAKMIGEWTYEGKFLMPGMEQTSSGTMSAKAILGGRFIQATWQGEFMGQPFEGIAIDGYDNVRKKHIGLWLDGMSTSFSTYSGDCDGTGKEITMTGRYFDPMEGREVEDISTMIWLDDDTFAFETFRVAPDGSRHKMMEMTVKRKR